MGDPKAPRSRSSPYARVQEVLFQGNDPKSYLRAAFKLLFAGALGVITGWVLQPFFSTVFGLPYWISYWPAVLAGFIVNLRTQVKIKNLKIEKADGIGA